MRILVADDNDEIRAAVRLLLEELGESDVLEATDQVQVLAAVELSPVDVVLLDWELPVSSSRAHDAPARDSRTATLVGELRRRATDCRIIAMSGRPEAQESSLRSGCDDFVSRTEPPDRLLDLLHIEGRGS
jgi:CheY-like chemotaxis protein